MPLHGRPLMPPRPGAGRARPCPTPMALAGHRGRVNPNRMGWRAAARFPVFPGRPMVRRMRPHAWQMVRT